MSLKSKLQDRTWTKDQYFITTDSSLIPISKLNAAFATPDIYWAKPVPDEIWQETLENSLCFGLYESKTSQSTTNHTTHENSSQYKPSDTEFIGIARLITDFVSFAYLTDVYVWPSHQGLGLGKWLIACVQELVDSMPYLRRSLLITSDWERSVPFYEKIMGMSVIEGRRSEDGKSGHGTAVMWKKFKQAKNFDEL